MGRTWITRAPEWTVVSGPQRSHLLLFMFLCSPPYIEWGWPSPSAGYWGNNVWLDRPWDPTASILLSFGSFTLAGSLMEMSIWSRTEATCQQSPPACQPPTSILLGSSSFKPLEGLQVTAVWPDIYNLLRDLHARTIQLGSLLNSWPLETLSICIVLSCYVFR